VKGETAMGWVHYEFAGVIRGSFQVGEVKQDYQEQVFRRRVMGYYDITYLKTPQGWRIKRRIERAAVSDTRAQFLNLK